MVGLTVPSHRSRRARAAAHRAMAFAALASDSSERVRYRRYHAHMRLAEALSRAADRAGPSAPQEVSA
ncbi:hypothetical protein DFO67_10287 [Modicisalibacter xianhensis]|uniref:Uncharacterized protein n=1 Tax=Modicisalibacter xianhensis TaxID=442341 RepID=A0A4R8G7F4_9GAMM|nr:hypothetical protein [Halomonas xianhensis]TDX32138.1 hypothetical protein DFO67_10287 [Halomonas xianhensis]